MKHIKKTFFSFLFLLFCSPLLAALTIVAKEEAPYVGNNLPGKGLSMEIIQTAFTRAGYETSLAFETWPRAYEGATIGVYDVLGSIWKTDARSQDFIFSEPYLYHQIKFVKKKSRADIKFRVLDDLNGLIIGTLKDYAYGNLFLNSRQIIKIPQNNLLQTLSLLGQDRVDLAVGDVRKINYELKNFMPHNIGKFEFIPKSLIRRGTHIAVSRSNPKHEEIVNRFNKALQEMQTDGTYDSIVKKHDSE